MLTTIKGCEIFLAGKIIEHEEAISLGGAVLRQYYAFKRDVHPFIHDRRLPIDYSSYSARTTLAADKNGRPNIAVSLSSEHRDTLDKVELKFKNLCATREAVFGGQTNSDIYIGTPKAIRGMRPHVDDVRHYRLITNLTSEALTLLVAKEGSWGKDDFTKDAMPMFRPERDIDYVECPFEPGEAMFVDNMFGDDFYQQVPHAGVDVTGKIILRTDYSRY